MPSASATALSETQQRPPQNLKPKTPRAVTLWRHACLTTPVVKPSPPQTPSVQTATLPPSSFRNLRRQAAPPAGVAAPNPSCSRSRGGMRGWPLLRPTHAPATSPQNKRQQRPATKNLNPSCSHSRGCTAPNDHSRGQHTHRYRSNSQPPNSSCCRSRGGMRGWPLPRPTHAPATTLKTNGNSAPHKNKKRIILFASLQRRDGAEWALLRPPRAAD